MTANDWLLAHTHHDGAWWMMACQRAFGEASTPSADPDHDDTDTAGALQAIVKRVMSALPKEEDYDPNMRAASIIAMILGLWATRVRYAKTHDPARPIEGRQKAYRKWVDFALALASLAIDDSNDPVYFPGQQWDQPFAYDAVDGGFV